MKRDRLAVLDGLRGIAVLLVLWYHIWEISWLPAPLSALQFIPETGFAGVHLFFFISGFVIVYPFVRARFANGAKPSWAQFAYRRAIKIVPSYVLSIAVAIAIGYAHFASAGDAVRDVGAHLLFVHTWFNDTYGSINGVLWTLAVEVQFYLLFPLVWWCFARAPWLTALGMIAVSIAYRAQAYACCLHGSMSHLIDNLPGYLDIFAFGMLSAYVYVRWREKIASRLAPWGFMLFAIAGFAFFAGLLENVWAMRDVDQWASVWQIYNRSWLGLAFAAIAVGSLFAPALWRRLLGNPVLLFLAAISYNLYLYHQMIARELLALRLPDYNGGDPHLHPAWQLAFTVTAFVATIAQAALVTYAFERPLLRIPLQAWRRATGSGPDVVKAP